MRVKVRRKGHLRRKGTQYHYVREHNMFTAKQRRTMTTALTIGMLGLAGAAMYRILR